MDKNNSKISLSKTDIIYISLIAFLILVIVGEFGYFHKKYSYVRTGPGMMQAQNTKESTSGRGPGGMPGMSMTAVTPPQLSDQQRTQLADGTAKTTTTKVFNITGGNFYFVPNKIVVNKGDQVTFVMTNAGGVHNLVIDELGIKTPVIHTADAATVTFTATQTGSFVYYCSVPTHKAKGMWGTLIVQ